MADNLLTFFASERLLDFGFGIIVMLLALGTTLTHLYPDSSDFFQNLAKTPLAYKLKFIFGIPLAVSICLLAVGRPGLANAVLNGTFAAFVTMVVFGVPALGIRWVYRKYRPTAAG